MNDAVANGDLDLFGERLHPDVVWEHNIGGGSVEEGIYRGRESVIRLLERVIEPWEYMRLEPEAIEQAPDGSLLIRGEMHTKHATTAAEISTPYQQETELKNGLLVHCRMTFGQLGSEGS